MRPKRAIALLSLALVPLAPITVLPAAPATSRVANDRASAAATVLDWQLIAIRTVFTEAGTAVPPGAVHLGVTSLAVYDAVRDSIRRGHGSARAAVATAAHDVLVARFPGSKANLDADLATTLAAVPDGPAEAKGVRIGRAAAARLLESRAGDGFGDPSVKYTLDPSVPGIWQQPPTGMAFPWLGKMRPLLLRNAVRLDGPDALTSATYAADFDEVRIDGSLAGTDAHKKAVADFFYINAVPSYQRALVTYLRSHPMDLRRTARMFAVMHASMADGLIEAWRRKLEDGFWRPFQAIARAAEDGNSATEPDPTWRPYRAAPPYSEYPSGHAVVTGTFAQAARMVLGDRVALDLVSVPVAPPGVTPPSRSYQTLSALEDEAFHGRIWAGIHFRDAMDDGYHLAHRTAERVAAQLD